MMGAVMSTKMKRRLATWLIATCAGLFGPVAASNAHIPTLLTPGHRHVANAATVVDGRQHVVFYGAMGRRDHRVIRLNMPAGATVKVELLIPDQAPENQLSKRRLPVAAIFAPDGSVAVLWPTERTAFYEPYTNTSYLSLGTYTRPAQAGTYTVLVATTSATRFAAATGTQESLSAQVEHGLCAPISDVQHWYTTSARQLAREQRDIHVPAGISTCLLSGGPAPSTSLMPAATTPSP
jgi:hypothetical protein